MTQSDINDMRSMISIGLYSKHEVSSCFDISVDEMELFLLKTPKDILKEAYGYQFSTPMCIVDYEGCTQEDPFEGISSLEGFSEWELNEIRVRQTGIIMP